MLVGLIWWVFRFVCWVDVFVVFICVWLIVMVGLALLDGVVCYLLMGGGLGWLVGLTSNLGWFTL